MKYSKLTYTRSIFQQVLSIVLMGAPSVIGLSALLLPILATPAAQAAPLPKDWCGRLWEIQTTTGTGAVIGWVNPNPGTNIGVSNSSPPPGITQLIPALPAGGSFAALGIHTQSGTLYTFDRSTSTLYRYSMSTGGNSWTTTSLSSQITANSSLNFNKMTVTGDTLILASANSLNTFELSITPATGAVGAAVSTNYTWATTSSFGTNPGGTPPGTRLIGSGDIAQDEYGGTYNIVYDGGNGTITANPQYAYFYKKVGTTWEYRGRAQKESISDQFTGLAVYNQTFYAKGTNGKLYSVPLTYTGTDATGEYNWTNSLTIKSVGSGLGSTDLASCGLPAISVNKTQSIYSDPLGTIKTPDQTRIGTGQYIKYTIVVSNQGDAWSKGTKLTDILPPGVTYVANSAYRNDVNMNAATYPFGSTPVDINSDLASVGEVRLAPFSITNAITYTFIVKVDGTAPSVANKAREWHR